MNVDSAATRAATRSDKKIEAIFAVIDSAEKACMIGRTSKTAEEEHGWLLTQPAALLCCRRGQAHIRDRQHEYRNGEVARWMDWIPYLLTCRYRCDLGHSEPFDQH